MLLPQFLFLMSGQCCDAVPSSTCNVTHHTWPAPLERGIPSKFKVLGASRPGAGGMESERDTLGASSLLIMFVLFSLHWAIGTWVLVVV